MVPIADPYPRPSLEDGFGQNARVSLGDVLEPDCGELDAAARKGRNGALSRTRLSQPEVRDDFGLGSWVPA